MTKIGSIFGIIATALVVLLSPGAARAQASLTWISGVGNDQGSCTRTAPCHTLGFASQVTLAGGEIDILDGGAFGSATISKSLTIVNVGAGVASVTLIELTSTVPADEVILRGLNFVPYDNSNYAVRELGAGSLVIDHCTFHEYQGAFAVGVVNSNGAVKLRVVDTVISNSGAGTAEAVYLGPQNGASLTAQFERVQIVGSYGNAIRADTTNNTNNAGPVSVQLHDVTVDGSSGGSGIVAVSPTSGGAKATIIADNVTSVNNAGYGLRAIGGTASIILSRSVIENNAIGIGASSGGQVFSYGDNRVINNSSGAGVTPTLVAPE